MQVKRQPRLDGSNSSMQAYFFCFVCYDCMCTFKNVCHAGHIQDVLEIFELKRCNGKNAK